MSRAGATQADASERGGPASRPAQDQGPLVGRENLAGSLTGRWSQGVRFMPFGVPWADPLSPPHPEKNVMSYESRQKKRRHKRIEATARRRRSPESARL